MRAFPLALKPAGSDSEPVMDVMSETPRLTSTTARVEEPSPGPTSFFAGLMIEGSGEVDDADEELADASVQ